MNWVFHFQQYEMLHGKIWKCFRTRCHSSSNFSRKAIFCDWIVNRLFVVNWAILLDTWKFYLLWLMHLSHQWSSQQAWCKSLGSMEPWFCGRGTSTVTNGSGLVFNEQTNDIWSLCILQTNPNWRKLQKNASLLWYDEDIWLTCIFDFSASWRSSNLLGWCATAFGYRTFALFDWERRPNGVIGHVNQLDIFRFLYMRLCETLCLLDSDKVSIS